MEREFKNIIRFGRKEETRNSAYTSTPTQESRKVDTLHVFSEQSKSYVQFESLDQDLSFSFSHAVNISIAGANNLVKTQIIDGDLIIEKANEKAREITFEMQFIDKRDLSDVGMNIHFDFMPFLNKCLKAGALKVTSPYLNDLGINYIAISSYNLKPSKGSLVQTLTLSTIELNSQYELS